MVKIGACPAAKCWSPAPMTMKVTITTTQSGPNIADAMTIPVECPQCGHKSDHTLRQLQDNPLLTCGSCNTQIQITGDELRELTHSLDKIDRLFDDFGKS